MNIFVTAFGGAFNTSRNSFAIKILREVNKKAHTLTRLERSRVLAHHPHWDASVRERYECGDTYTITALTLTIGSSRKRISIVGHFCSTVNAWLPVVTSCVPGHDSGIFAACQYTQPLLFNRAGIPNPAFFRCTMFVVDASLVAPFQVPHSLKVWCSGSTTFTPC